MPVLKNTLVKSTSTGEYKPSLGIKKIFFSSKDNDKKVKMELLKVLV